VWTAEQLLHLADVEPRRLVLIVLDLQSRLALNSRNSSKPPSSDGLLKPAPKSLRQPTGRKPGGQQGHPGCTLRPVDKPDEIVAIPLDVCPRGCGTSLKKRPVSSYVARQVFDLPPQKLFVTEHRAETKRCPSCDVLVTAPFPPHVAAPAQYGKRFLAFLIYLRDQQFIASDRVSQLCSDLFGHGVSEQIVQDAETAAYQNLEGFETQIMALLPSAKILHADETGLRVEARLQWVHTLGSRLLTWYGLHARRGRLAMKHFSILPRFHGRLIHDCLASYFEWPCLHGLCNAHLLRELTFLFETLRQDWAGKMIHLLLNMNKRVNELKALGRFRLSKRERASWIRRYNVLLAQGRAANPPPPRSSMSRRGRPKKSKAVNLLDRMLRHKKSALAFLYDFRVPFTNNRAEQILRMLKVRQKISGGFRTTPGAKRFLRLRSYIATVRNHDRPVFQALIDAIAGHPFIPVSPA
jgi:transposase